MRQLSLLFRAQLPPAARPASRPSTSGVRVARGALARGLPRLADCGSDEQRRQRRSRMPLLATLEALPSAILAGVVALIVSRPVGLYLQEKFTTDGDLGDLRVVDVRKITPSPVTRIFRLLLAPGRELTTTAYRIDTTG